MVSSQRTAKPPKSNQASFNRPEYCPKLHPNRRSKASKKNKEKRKLSMKSLLRHQKTRNRSESMIQLRKINQQNRQKRLHEKNQPRKMKTASRLTAPQNKSLSPQNMTTMRKKTKANESKKRLHRNEEPRKSNQQDKHCQNQ